MFGRILASSFFPPTSLFQWNLVQKICFFRMSSHVVWVRVPLFLQGRLLGGAVAIALTMLMCCSVGSPLDVSMLLMSFDQSTFLSFLRLRSWCFTWRHLATPNLVAWMLQERFFACRDVWIMFLQDFLDMWICVCNTDPLIMDNGLLIQDIGALHCNNKKEHRCCWALSIFLMVCTRFTFQRTLDFCSNVWRFFSQLYNFKGVLQTAFGGVLRPWRQSLGCTSGKKHPEIS